MHERTTTRRTAACMTNYGRGSSSLWSSYALDLARPRESPHVNPSKGTPHSIAYHLTAVTASFFTEPFQMLAQISADIAAECHSHVCLHSDSKLLEIAAVVQEIYLQQHATPSYNYITKM